MKKIKYHSLIVLIISMMTLIVIPGCIPDLADITPPVVEIVSPLADATVNGTIEVIASASDDYDIKAVTIYIDGKWALTSANSVAVYSWDTTPFADNLQHFISAVATDNSDNVGAAPALSVTVVTGQNADNIPPTVSIVSPLKDQVVSGTVNIVAEASDNTGVARVEFYIDGFVEDTATTPPYTYLWNTAQTNAGVHTIFARAFDTNNNSGVSETIPATVDTTFDDTDPIVTILNPVDGQVVSGNVNIVAEASDNVEVDRVEFYIDGFLEETVNNRPFDYLWNTTPVNPGFHTIFARAYDTSNNTSASPTISVTVDSSASDASFAPGNGITATPDLAIGNISPKVSIESPNRNGIFFSETETKQIPIEVKTTSAVRRIEFYIDGNLQEVVDRTLNDRVTYHWYIDGYGDGLLHTIFVKGIDESSNGAADMIAVRIYP
jgi:hypothetical protein